MLVMTIKKALENPIDTEEHYLYLYRDGDIVFYVGQSYSPIDRLIQHLGHSYPYSSDLIGQLIMDNDSANWLIEMYTLEDCTAFISNHWAANYYRETVKDPRKKQSELQQLKNAAEESMMMHFKPCLNIKNHSNPAFQTRLPDRYIKDIDEPVNKGMGNLPGMNVLSDK